MAFGLFWVCFGLFLAVFWPFFGLGRPPGSGRGRLFLCSPAVPLRFLRLFGAVLAAFRPRRRKIFALRGPAFVVFWSFLGLFFQFRCSAGPFSGRNIFRIFFRVAGLDRSRPFTPCYVFVFWSEVDFWGQTGPEKILGFFGLFCLPRPGPGMLVYQEWVGVRFFGRRIFRPGEIFFGRANFAPAPLCPFSGPVSIFFWFFFFFGPGPGWEGREGGWLHPQIRYIIEVRVRA